MAICSIIKLGSNVSIWRTLSRRNSWSCNRFGPGKDRDLTSVNWWLAIENASAVAKWGFFLKYIPLHRPYIGLIYGRYLHFRILKWPLNIMKVIKTMFQTTNQGFSRLKSAPPQPVARHPSCRSSRGPDPRLPRCSLRFFRPCWFPFPDFMVFLVCDLPI